MDGFCFTVLAGEAYSIILVTGTLTGVTVGFCVDCGAFCRSKDSESTFLFVIDPTIPLGVSTMPLRDFLVIDASSSEDELSESEGDVEPELELESESESELEFSPLFALEEN